MMFLYKKVISKERLFVFLFLITIFISSISYGATYTTRVSNNEINQYNISAEEITVYVGNISNKGVSQIKYLYTEENVSIEALNEIRKILNSDYADLLPTEGGQIKVSNSHQGDMNSNWKDALTVANEYYKGTIKDTSSIKLYNETEFNSLVFSCQEKVNDEKKVEIHNLEEYNTRKKEWDTIENTRHDIYNSYIKSEFPEEYIPYFNDNVSYPSSNYFIADNISEKIIDNGNSYFYGFIDGNYSKVNTFDIDRKIIKIINTSANIITDEIPQTTLQHQITVDSNPVTLYIGNVLVDGKSKIKYLYTDQSVNEMTIKTIKSFLNDDYKDLVSISSGQIKSSNNYKADMSDLWKNAQDVAKKYYNGTITDVPNTKLYNDEKYNKLITDTKSLIVAENNILQTYDNNYVVEKSNWEVTHENSDFADLYTYEPPIITNNDLSSITDDYINVDAITNLGIKNLLYNGKSQTINYVEVDRTVLKIVNTSVNVTTDENLPFIDVDPLSWYYSSIKYVYGCNLMKGYTDTIFGPENNITRGQLVTILYRREGSPKTNYQMNFSDIPTNYSEKYYYDAIKWAVENGIVTGYKRGVNSGKFKPDDPITREQLALILQRFSKYQGKNYTSQGAITEFSDCNKVSNYAKDGMKWAVSVGIIKGNGNKTLNPQGNASRAECASMIMRYCEDVK